MEDAGKVMNLSGHVVAGKTIYGPGDIEVHVGKVNIFFWTGDARENLKKKKKKN
jgi:hypothetical protein